MARSGLRRISATDPDPHHRRGRFAGSLAASGISARGSDGSQAPQFAQNWMTLYTDSFHLEMVNLTGSFPAR